MVDSETIEIFYWDIVDCIAKIYSCHDLVSHLKVKPKRHYVNADMTIRTYSEAHTGKWWWEVQVSTGVRKMLHGMTHLWLRRLLRKKPPVRLSSQSISHQMKHSSHCSWENQRTQCTLQLGMCQRRSVGNLQPILRSSSHISQSPIWTTLQANPASVTQARICFMLVCSESYVHWRGQVQKVCG